mgnify:FL=1
MQNTSLMSIIFEVIKSPYVIGTTIVVILLMNFCCFVANYRKKPVVQKKVKKGLAPKTGEKPAEAAAEPPAPEANAAPAPDAN